MALAETRPDLNPAPSYATLRRFLKANGLDKRRRVTSRQTAGADRAEARLFDREVRSYEAAYVNGLWHWDCHHGSAIRQDRSIQANAARFGCPAVSVRGARPQRPRCSP